MATEEHRLDHADPFYNLTNAVEYVCVCGWRGRRWNEHAEQTGAKPLPPTPQPRRISREELRRAIYGDRSN